MQRLNRPAIWVFVLAYMVAQIQAAGGRPSIDLKPHIFEIGALVFMSAVGVAQGGKGIAKAVRVVWLALLVGLPGFWLYGGLAGDGSDGQYLYAWMQWVMYLGVTAAIAYQFFTERDFVDIWFKVASGATLFALVGFAAGALLGRMEFVQYADYGGGLRLTGALSEPSAWSPVLPGLLLLALHKKSWPVAGLAALGIFLVRSPTVFLTLAITVAIVTLLRPGRLWFKGLCLVVAAILVPAFWSLLSDPMASDRLVATGNPAKIMLGRLLGGLQFVQTGGAVGDNARFAGAEEVWDVLSRNGWVWTGRGLGAGDVYFLQTIGDFRTYSLPLNILFNLGLAGLIGYSVLALLAIWRLRSRTIGLALIPFIVASTINSAQGFQLYKFVGLAILVYVFGRGSASDGDPPGAVRGEGAQRGVSLPPGRTGR